MEIIYMVKVICFCMSHRNDIYALCLYFYNDLRSSYSIWAVLTEIPARIQHHLVMANTIL